MKLETQFTKIEKVQTSGKVQSLIKHGGYHIRVHPGSLQLISNNNVDIPEPFEKNK